MKYIIGVVVIKGGKGGEGRGVKLKIYYIFTINTSTNYLVIDLILGTEENCGAYEVTDPPTPFSLSFFMCQGCYFYVAVILSLLIIRWKTAHPIGSF